MISQTDESFTPSTIDKSTATSPIKISTDLKCNLQDINDVDSRDDLSSTKSKRKSIGEETPFLIPKVEKWVGFGYNEHLIIFDVAFVLKIFWLFGMIFIFGSFLDVL